MDGWMHKSKSIDSLSACFAAASLIKDDLELNIATSTIRKRLIEGKLRISRKVPILTRPARTV